MCGEQANGAAGGGEGGSGAKLLAVSESRASLVERGPDCLGSVGLLWTWREPSGYTGCLCALPKKHLFNMSPALASRGL